MSIQSKLAELERSKEDTSTKIIPVIEYFQSAKVSQLMHKIISNLKESDYRLSESNQNFKLYLYHDKLEMFRYETSISEMPKFHIPGLGDSTKEIKTCELKIAKFAESLSASELIENLEDLLFSS